MLTGLTPVSLKERDLICSAIGVSPVNIVIRRGDLVESSDYLDLSWMPEGMQKLLTEFCRTLKFSLTKNEVAKRYGNSHIGPVTGLGALRPAATT